VTAGVLRTQTLEEVFDVAQALRGNEPLTAGRADRAAARVADYEDWRRRTPDVLPSLDDIEPYLRRLR
jgi:hypothetical protein